MTIAQRLYVLIGMIAIALAALGGAGIYQMRQIYDAANYANVNTVPSLLVLDDAYDNLFKMRIDVWQHLVLTDPAQMAEEHKTINNAAADVTRALERYERDNITDARDGALLMADRTALAAYKGLVAKVLVLSTAGDKEAARDLQLQQQGVIMKMDAAVAAHRAYNVEIGKTGAENGMAKLQQSIWAAVIVILLAIGGIGGMGIVLARRIASSLKEAVSIAQSVAAGDLTRKIDVVSGDEVGQLMSSLRDMNSNLVGIVTEVRQGTDTIATSSTQIAAGNLDLSSRTEQQAGALEETASSMEELTSTVKQNSDNARQANSLAATASDVALSGGAIVAQVVEKMTSISDSSRKISDITSVIDGIAFQTNILALNAAVEAARAGEQGRGFAVVATEVRNLAQRSAAAAKEIKGLIEDSVGHVDAGSKLVEEAGVAMQNIVESVRRVTAVVNEISTASNEQSDGIEQINRAIIEMDGATQQNAALVEQAAAAASSLQEQATTLTHAVSVFKLGAAPAQRVVAAPPPAKMAQPRPLPAVPSRSMVVAKSKQPASRVQNTVAAHEGDWEEF